MLAPGTRPPSFSLLWAPWPCHSHGPLSACVPSAPRWPLGPWCLRWIPRPAARSVPWSTAAAGTRVACPWAHWVCRGQGLVAPSGVCSLGVLRGSGRLTPPCRVSPGISELGGGPSAGRKGGGAGASRELPAHNGQPGRLPEEGGGAGHPSLLVAVWQNPGGGSVLAPPGFDHLPERGRLAPEEVTRSAPAHPPGPAQAGSWDPIKQSTLAPHGGVASYVPGCPCQAAQDAWLGSRACGTLAGAGEGSVSSPLHLRLGTLTPFFGTAQGGSQDSVSCSALPTPATRGRVAGPLCVLFPSLGWAVRWAGPALA